MGRDHHGPPAAVVAGQPVCQALLVVPALVQVEPGFFSGFAHGRVTAGGIAGLQAPTGEGHVPGPGVPGRWARWIKNSSPSAIPPR